MYEIVFYWDAQGRSPVEEWLEYLRENRFKSKDARIQYKKITTYLSMLELSGTRAGEPYVKHIEGDIWELRPLENRVLFFFWRDNKFVLLHHFVKKTQKTPVIEIDRARRNMQDFLARSE